MSSNDLVNSSYEDLLARKETIRSRMAQLSSKGNDDVQVLPGSTEVHWDNVMNTLLWCLVCFCFCVVPYPIHVNPFPDSVGLQTTSKKRGNDT